MAEKKKNILKDKLDQHVEGGPQNSDWAAMNSMIDAHPALNKRKRGGAAFRLVMTGAALLLLLSAGTAWYLFSDVDQTGSDQSEQAETNAAHSNSDAPKQNDQMTETPESEQGEREHEPIAQTGGNTEKEEQQTNARRKAETEERTSQSEPKPDDNNRRQKTERNKSEADAAVRSEPEVPESEMNQQTEETQPTSPSSESEDQDKRDLPEHSAELTALERKTEQSGREENEQASDELREREQKTEETEQPAGLEKPENNDETDLSEHSSESIALESKDERSDQAEEEITEQTENEVPESRAEQKTAEEKQASPSDEAEDKITLSQHSSTATALEEETEDDLQPADEGNTKQTAAVIAEEPVSVFAKKAPAKLNQSGSTEIDRKALHPDTAMSREILQRSPLKLSNLNAGIHYTAVPNDDLFGYGAGVDVDFQKGRFLLNTGVYFTRFNHTQPYMHSKVDTQLTIETEERTEMNVDSSWVLTGPNKGYYEYDTSYVTRHDTTTKAKLDTVNEERKRTTRLSYVEVPLAAGYRFHMGKWGLDVYGGVVLHQLTSKQQTGETEQPTKVVKEFGADLMFQPEVRYLFSSNYAVYVRSALRYPLTPSASIERKRAYGNIQLGLSYMW